MNRHAAARLDALERRVSALESPTTADPLDLGPVRELTERDSRADIDAYAAYLGIDTTGEPNKAAALDRIGGRA